MPTRAPRILACALALVRLGGSVLAPSIHPPNDASPFNRIVYWRPQEMEHDHPGQWDQNEYNNHHGEEDEPTTNRCPTYSNHVTPPVHKSVSSHASFKRYRHSDCQLGFHRFKVCLRGHGTRLPHGRASRRQYACLTSVTARSSLAPSATILVTLSRFLAILLLVLDVDVQDRAHSERRHILEDVDAER